MPRIILECIHADTCLPDYWDGHHMPHVQIPVHKGITLKAIKKRLEEELRDGAVMGSHPYAVALGAELVQDEKFADAVTAAAFAAVRRIQPTTKGQKRFFTGLEEQTEDEESVYAYFVFMDKPQE